MGSLLLGGLACAEEVPLGGRWAGDGGGPDGGPDGGVPPGAVRLTMAAGHSSAPSVAAGAGEFGVAWQDERHGDVEIYFVRVGSDGAKLGEELRVSSAAGLSHRPTLVSNGSGYAVAWQDGRDGNSEIYFARVGPDGSKLGDDVRVTTDSAMSSMPALVFTGSEYGIVWDSFEATRSRIRFARLDREGVALEAPVDVTTGDRPQYTPALTHGQNEYGLAWAEGTGGADIFFSRMSLGGSLVSEPIQVTDDLLHSQYPAVDYTGSGFGVAYNNDDGDSSSQMLLLHLDGSGGRLGPVHVSREDRGVSGRPSLLFTGSEHAMVWQNSSEEVLMGRALDGGAAIGSPVVLQERPANARQPDVAFADGLFFVAWDDSRNGDLEIYFTLVPE